MTDVYDWRGKPVEWEPDDVPGPTVEQLNAIIDSLNAALFQVNAENAQLRIAARAVVRSWNDGERVGLPMQELEALVETE